MARWKVTVGTHLANSSLGIIQHSEEESHFACQAELFVRLRRMLDHRIPAHFNCQLRRGCRIRELSSTQDNTSNAEECWDYSRPGAPQGWNEIEDLPQRIGVAVGNAVFQSRKSGPVVRQEVEVPDTASSCLLLDQ